MIKKLTPVLIIVLTVFLGGNGSHGFALSGSKGGTRNIAGGHTGNGLVAKGDKVGNGRKGGSSTSGLVGGVGSRGGLVAKGVGVRNGYFGGSKVGGGLRRGHGTDNGLAYNCGTERGGGRVGG